jgi:hypothetical protein
VVYEHLEECFDITGTETSGSLTRTYSGAQALYSVDVEPYCRYRAVQTDRTLLTG